MNANEEQELSRTEEDIQAFWDANPCGESLVGGKEADETWEAFFERYDNYRYTEIKHILPCLDQIDFQGKSVLEIGLGQGADSEQIIRRGARWSGLDLTPEAIARVKHRFALRKLPYEEILEGSALENPYPDNQFDIVFSYGVLHHIPDVLKAQEEIHRVLKPGGKLIIMVYAKHSLNYLVSIKGIRRLGLLALYYLYPNVGGMYGQHVANAKKTGLFKYLRSRNFIHHNTDGPLNPYSKVYARKELNADFPLFTIDRIHKEFLHAPPLPVNSLPGAEGGLSSVLGWSLWAHLDPIKK